MATTTRYIGLSLGADLCWPICYEEIVRRLDLKIPHRSDTLEFEVERVTIEPFDLQQPCKYAVVLDRLTHWYHTSREWIKKAVVLDDLYVLNNPWTLQSMEKQTTFCAMMRLGFPVPRTWMVPPKAYDEHDDLAPTLERYACLFDLGQVGESLGYPLFMKPYDGGAWKGVNKIDDEKKLRQAYEESGVNVMHLQEAVDYDLFVRCLGVGPQVNVIPYDPVAPLHARYQVPPERSDRNGDDFLDDGELRTLRRMTLTINSFFGWDQLLRVSAPGRRLPSHRLRQRLSGLPGDLAPLPLPVTDQRPRPGWSIFCAATLRKMRQNVDWEPYYEIARRDLSFEDKLTEYGRIAAERLDAGRFHEFCDRHLSHLDEVSWEFFGTEETTRGAVRAKVEELYPEHEVEEFTDRFWGLIQVWRDREPAGVSAKAGDPDLASVSGERRRLALAAVGLLLLAGVSFAPRIQDLGLVHDDWSYYLDVARGSSPVASPGGLRPFHAVSWRLCGRLFGDDLAGYYLVLFALQWLAALFLYSLARRHAGWLPAFAFAALAMVYPGDASHLWLGSMPHRSAWMLALLAMVLGEQAAGSRGAGQVWMVPAAVLGLCSLAVYELHFFLLALWPALAWLMGAPWRRRHLLAWCSIPALYLGWRFLVRPAAGGPTVVNTELLWDPLEIIRRSALLVPFNLFGDGWWIALEEVVGSPWAIALFFAAAATAAVTLVGRFVEREDAAGRRELARRAAAGLALIALGVAPIVPTTYWLGRTAGTFAGRILACALPGAALLLFVAVAYIVRDRRGRGLAYAALLILAFAFHWNVGKVAAENWRVQQRLTESLEASGCPWPGESFLVFLDLPPNRLGFDTPWGMGRMIGVTCDDPTLSGIGLPRDRAPAEILSIDSRNLLVHGGSFAQVPLDRVVFLRWNETGELGDRLEIVSAPNV